VPPTTPRPAPARALGRSRLGAGIAGTTAIIAAVIALVASIEPAASANVARADGLALPTATRPASGQGYHLVSADGGVFSLGWLPNAGSMAGQSANSEITGVALSPRGGYWLAGADGGVFAFGDADYFGSVRNSGVITAIAATPTGKGYWLASRDGGIFAFGDAGYHGSLHGSRLTTEGVVAIAATPTGDGYWLAGADGGVFAFGDADYFGSLSGRQISAGVVAAAAGRGAHRPEPLEVVERSLPPVTPPPTAPPPTRRLPADSSTRTEGAADAGGRTGYDISYPQCDRAYPEAPYAFGIVGVTRGRAFRHNPCLASQWRWATASGAAGVYINVNFPGPANELALGATGPQPNCNGDLPCIAYNFGFNGAQDALNYAASQRVAAPFVWLDIETMNYWTSDRPLNAVVVRGAIDAVRQAGKEPGIYSTPYQWKTIAGDFAPGVPVWIAGSPNLSAAPGWCRRSFAGGPVVMVQTLPVVFDENHTCPGHGPVRRFFAT